LDLDDLRRRVADVLHLAGADHVYDVDPIHNLADDRVRSTSCAVSAATMKN
jgi:hypothetical protein